MKNRIARHLSAGPVPLSLRQTDWDGVDHAEPKVARVRRSERHVTVRLHGQLNDYRETLVLTPSAARELAHLLLEAAG